MNPSNDEPDDPIQELWARLSPEEQARTQASVIECYNILAQAETYQKDLLRRLGVRTNLEDRDEYWIQLWAAARAAGISQDEFWKLTGRELCAVLEHRAFELELLGQTAPPLPNCVVQKVSELAPTLPAKPGAAVIGAGSGSSDKQGHRHRGPTTDYETAKRVAQVVADIAAGEPWRSKLDDICVELDERKVKLPKTWKKKGYADWLECLARERHLVVEAIKHHLENAAKAGVETFP